MAAYLLAKKLKKSNSTASFNNSGINNDSNDYEYNKSCLLNNRTNLLQKKKEDNLKLVFPVVFLSDSKNFFNNSEKRRYTKTKELFLKLKYLIERDETNKFAYIREVNSLFLQSSFTQME